MTFELKLLEQRITELEAENFEAKIAKVRQEHAEFLERIIKLERALDDVKKLENIINHDRQKRCICQDNGIFLIEVWYDQNPEIVIPERIRKIKEFICLASKSFDIL